MSAGPSSSGRRACPYLGIQLDPAIHYGFPVLDNLCFAEKSIASVPLDHQTSYCLNEAHDGCPYYQAATARRAPTAAALAEIISPQESRKRRMLSALLFLALGAGSVLLAVVLLLLIGGASWPGGPHLAVPVEAVTTNDSTPGVFIVSPTSTSTPTPRPTATASPAVTPTHSPTVRPTATPTPRPPRVTPTAPPVATALTHTVAALCTPAPTAAPTPFLIVAVPALNLRAKTESNAPVIQVAYNGDRLAVVGRDETGRWVQTCCLGGWPGWVLVQHVNLSVPVMSLPLASATPAVTPAATTQTP